MISLVDDIIDELQKCGGATGINLLRGKGVEYSVILKDVCEAVKCPFDKDKSIEENEVQLLNTVFMKIINDPKLPDDFIKEQAVQFGVKDVGSKSAIIAAIQLAIKSGGFASYQIAVIVANTLSKAILGRGLALAVNAGITRYLAVFAGPLGWAFTTLLALFDLSKPATRITIPCVIQIAYMRQKFNNAAYEYSN